MQHTSCCYEGSYAQYHGDAEDQDDYIPSDFLRRHSRYRHGQPLNVTPPSIPAKYTNHCNYQNSKETA